MPAMLARARLLAAAMAAVALAGCGDDGDDSPAPPPAPAPTTQAAPPAPREEERPEPRREKKTVVDCLRAAPRVEDVLEKGGDSEDARYFEELVGGRVTVLAITLQGESAEVDAFVFASSADAKEAAPAAGGAGLKVSVHGRAVLVAPPSAETAAIERCLGTA